MESHDWPAPDHSTSKPANVLDGIHRLQAHLEIVEAMINDDASVVDIVTELNRANALARHAGLFVLQHHVSECLLDDPLHRQATSVTRTRELIEAIKRFTFAVS